jgi:hypothetical protein
MVDDFKINLVQMMENAGRNLADLARRRFLDDDLTGRKIVVLSISGGNGRRSLVCARWLHNQRADVTVYVIRPDDESSPVPAHQLEILLRMRVPVSPGEFPSKSASLIPSDLRKAPHHQPAPTPPTAYPDQPDLLLPPTTAQPRRHAAILLSARFSWTQLSPGLGRLLPRRLRIRGRLLLLRGLGKLCRRWLVGRCGGGGWLGVAG